MLRVELCGRLAEPCGRELVLDWPAAGAPAGMLIEALSRAFPPLVSALMQGRVRVCVNEVIVADEALVGPEDEVALFPPVSGG